MNEEHFRRYAELLVKVGVNLRPGQSLSLIGEDSMIADSGLFFDEVIFDENASSHVALGQAYVEAVAGGESMGRRQLDALGVNHSAIHTDVMFGSPEVTIVATESREGEAVLIDRGRWARRFLDQPSRGG